MNWLLFISAFASVSLLPGLNMTLALSTGIACGYKNTLPLTLAIAGVTIVVAAICAVFGGIILSLNAQIIRVFTIICALYLLYVSYKMFKSAEFNLELSALNSAPKTLVMRGFLCAISNPKAWAFFVALIPPFLDAQNPFGARFYEILIVMFVIEFTNLNIYALGGAAFKKILAQKAYILEKFGAILVAAIALLMIFDKL